MCDHPVIERMERTGYAFEIDNSRGFDTLGNPINKGDVLLELNDRTFVKDAIMFETLTALEMAGAERIEVE